MNRIYLDAGSIHAAFEKSHPSVTGGAVHFNRSTSGPFAWFNDYSRLKDGEECTIERDDERWSYYGLSIGIIRWASKPRHTTREESK